MAAGLLKKKAKSAPSEVGDFPQDSLQQLVKGATFGNQGSERKVARDDTGRTAPFAEARSAAAAEGLRGFGGILNKDTLLGNLMNNNNHSTLNGGFGSASNSTVLAELSAALGGGAQDMHIPMTEETFHRITSMNIFLRDENVALRQRVASLSAALESQLYAACRHCGKISGTPTGHDDGDNTIANLLKQVQQPVAGANPVMSQLEVLKLLHQAQYEHQEKLHRQHGTRQNAADLTTFLTWVKSSGNAMQNTNKVDDMNKVLMAVQDAYPGTADALSSLLSAEPLQQQYMRDGGSLLQQSLLGSLTHGARSDNIGAANNALHALIMNAEKDKVLQESIQTSPVSDPMSALLKTIHMHQKAITTSAQAAPGTGTITAGPDESNNSVHKLVGEKRPYEDGPKGGGIDF